MRKVLLILAVGGIVLASCGNQGAEQAVAQATQQDQTQQQAKVQQATQQAQEEVIVNVGAPKFKELVESGACEVIDVRTPQEYAEGHIKGAQNIDIYNPEFDKLIGQLPKDKTYCVYCRSGRRSMMAAQKMAQMGFKKVYNLQGGIIAWQQSGNPVEK